MTDSLVTIDASNAVRVLDRRSRRASGASTLANSPGHSSAVLGVSALRTPADDRAAYMTWAADGSILSWTLKGEVLSQVKIVLEQPRSSGGDAPPNELKVLRISPDSTYFVTGDKLGILRIHDLRSGEVKRLQAHAAEITDIAIHQSDEMALIASAGRDRSVARLFFLKGGERLVSCCADRTVVVRDLASRQLETGPSFAYVPVRTIGLKATPVSMTFSSEDEETLIISTIDRNIHSIDVPSGRVNRTFRASDPDSKDAVVMDALASDSVDAASNGSKVIVGIATTDKSIRIYDESGSLIAKEWGHTEGISDLVILDAAPEQPGKTKTLISTGLDGTIFIWEYTPKPQILPEDSISADPTKELLGTQETPIFRTPLRKVLSRSELATFRKRSDLEMCSPEPSPPNTPSLPRVRKRTSKYTLASAKPETPPVPCPPAHLDLSASKVVPSPDRSPMERRSPPVYSPSRPVATPPETAPRSSLARSRTKSTGNLTELSMVTSTTEQICRALRSYRKKLATSPDTNLPTSSVKELERELALTTKALGERGARDREATAAAVTPTALNQILDQYSERLVQMVEKRIGGVTLAEDEEMNARKDTLEVGPKVEGVKDRDE
ncbi:MAG: hypothetical protein M1817_002690 [Caeruleum heppii]|nr:MAG: hypothetical protein M1817_002690 [Caeruleum heppii]